MRQHTRVAGGKSNAQAIFAPEEIRALYEAAIAAGLQNRREALLTGIDPAITAALTTSPTPGDQLRLDLARLNTMRVMRGPAPIETWLSNALVMVGGQVEGQVFEQALARVPKGETGSLPGLPSKDARLSLIARLWEHWPAFLAVGILGVLLFLGRSVGIGVLANLSPIGALIGEVCVVGLALLLVGWMRGRMAVLSTPSVGKQLMFGCACGVGAGSLVLGLIEGIVFISTESLRLGRIRREVLEEWVVQGRGVWVGAMGVAVLLFWVGNWGARRG